MRVQDWQADTIEKAAAILGFWVVSTPKDKLLWAPAVDETSRTRTVIDMIQECIQVNTAFAAMLAGMERPSPDRVPGASGPLEAAAAETYLNESAHLLADAIRSSPDSTFDQSFETPFGPMTGAELMRIAAANMHYHGGQLNYVQRLYGDVEFHIPGRG